MVYWNFYLALNTLRCSITTAVSLWDANTLQWLPPNPKALELYQMQKKTTAGSMRSVREGAALPREHRLWVAVLTMMLNWFSHQFLIFCLSNLKIYLLPITKKNQYDWAHSPFHQNYALARVYNSAVSCDSNFPFQPCDTQRQVQWQQMLQMFYR